MKVKTDPHVLLRIMRRASITRIKRIVAPKLRNSGYVDESEPSGTVQLIAFDEAVRFKGKGYIQEVFGFTKSGVLTDAFGGAAVDTPWREICLEDLIKLESLAKRLWPATGEYVIVGNVICAQSPCEPTCIKVLRDLLQRFYGCEQALAGRFEIVEGPKPRNRVVVIEGREMADPGYYDAFQVEFTRDVCDDADVVRPSLRPAKTCEKH